MEKIIPNDKLKQINSEERLVMACLCEDLKQQGLTIAFDAQCHLVENIIDIKSTDWGQKYNWNLLLLVKQAMKELEKIFGSIQIRQNNQLDNYSKISYNIMDSQYHTYGGEYKQPKQVPQLLINFIDVEVVDNISIVDTLNDLMDESEKDFNNIANQDLDWHYLLHSIYYVDQKDKTVNVITNIEKNQKYHLWWKCTETLLEDCITYERTSQFMQEELNIDEDSSKLKQAYKYKSVRSNTSLKKFIRVYHLSDLNKCWNCEKMNSNPNGYKFQFCSECVRFACPPCLGLVFNKKVTKEEIDKVKDLCLCSSLFRGCKTKTQNQQAYLNVLKKEARKAFQYEKNAMYQAAKSRGQMNQTVKKSMKKYIQKFCFIMQTVSQLDYKSDKKEALEFLKPLIDLMLEGKDYLRYYIIDFEKTHSCHNQERVNQINQIRIEVTDCCKDGSMILLLNNCIAYFFDTENYCAKSYNYKNCLGVWLNLTTSYPLEEVQLQSHGKKVFIKEQKQYDITPILQQQYLEFNNQILKDMKRAGVDKNYIQECHSKMVQSFNEPVWDLQGVSNFIFYHFYYPYQYKILQSPPEKLQKKRKKTKTRTEHYDQPKRQKIKLEDQLDGFVQELFGSLENQYVEEVQKLKDSYNNLDYEKIAEPECKLSVSFLNLLEFGDWTKTVWELVQIHNQQIVKDL